MDKKVIISTYTRKTASLLPFRKVGLASVKIRDLCRSRKLACYFSRRKRLKNKKSLYLSVNVFSTAVLIEDTVNSETNIINQTETCCINDTCVHTYENRKCSHLRALRVSG